MLSEYEICDCTSLSNLVVHDQDAEFRDLLDERDVQLLGSFHEWVEAFILTALGFEQLALR